jgi:diguanylate cyclase
VARLLQEEARETDIIARYGGDEFVVIMPQSNLDAAMVAAERLRQKIERDTSLTISVGVASAGKGDTPEALFHRADTALYRAKVAGRNRVFAHHPGGVGTPDDSAAPLDNEVPCQA